MNNFKLEYDSLKLTILCFEEKRYDPPFILRKKSSSFLFLLCSNLLKFYFCYQFEAVCFKEFGSTFRTSICSPASGPLVQLEASHMMPRYLIPYSEMCISQ